MSGIRFDRAVCGNPDEALQREWLETNGLGGFASSTISGANTRRYHGLLIAAVEPIVRVLLLSKLEETLIVGDRRFELSTNLYPGVTHPDGFRFQSGFRLDPFPIFTFEAGGVTLEKRVFLVDGENTVVVEYEALAGTPCALELRPLVAFRGYHDLTHENAALDKTLNESAGSFSIQPYPGLPVSILGTTLPPWRRRAIGTAILNTLSSANAVSISTKTFFARPCSGSISRPAKPRW
ncbi:MAG: glycogen debranching enzyme N-terminal domain-containing protein [Acidobacteriota bacterium]|nr:glycogen debranching enzyme N-terminal domain-containing protein [Acidobacteriota bacterium]